MVPDIWPAQPDHRCLPASLHRALWVLSETLVRQRSEISKMACLCPCLVSVTAICHTNLNRPARSPAIRFLGNTL